MPNFTYTGADERYYPSLSLAVEPGDSATLDADPGDGRWTESGSTPAAPITLPESPADSPEVGN